MTVYSRFAALINGVERGVDLSTNTLNVGALEIGGTLLSQAGIFATYVGTPAGAATPVTITANNPGAVGDVPLTFSGSNTIAGEIATWNGANPGNMVTLTSGVGTQTPSAGTISLTGGSSVSGSSLIGNMNVYTNFTPTAATIAGALLGIDSALAGVSGSAITSLTGDVTATGPGAAAATLATVATPGTSTKVTYDAKGRITSGTTLSSGDIPNNAANTSGSAGSFTGSLAGDVTGTQGATVVSKIAGVSVGTPTGTGNIVFSGSPTLTGTLTAATISASGTVTGSNLSGSSSGTNTGDQTITLTGDVTGSGTGSFATTLAATTNATITTLSGLTSASSLATVGTITSGTWNGTVVDVAHGGTGAATLTLDGILYGKGTSAVGITAAGTDGQVLTAHTGSAPTWASPATSGTVTSVALADASTTPIYSISGSPVTSAGTLTLTLTTQTANTVFAGPATAGPSEPTFRSLVAADIPSLSATYLPLAGGTMSGAIAMGANKITGLASGTASGDALQFGQIGAANGVAGLDGSGKVPLSQLPATLMEFKGSWNPTTNTPTLVDGTGTTGFTYWVSALDTGAVSGLTDPSMTNFQIGDLVIYNGTAWVLVTPAAGVQSVNGAQGAVTMSMATANGFAGTYTGTALTVSTTITGLLKGNGTAISAASAGTDYVIPSGSITGTASNITASSNSTLTTLSALSLPGSQVTGDIAGNAANVTGTVAIGHGGTGQTTAAAAFNALNPMTTTGDMIYESATGVASRLPIGSSTQVLTVVAGIPTWAAPATSGTVTSVALTVPSFLSVSGSPVTSSGTLAVTLATEAANFVFAGPASGSAATPTFRALGAADIPSAPAVITTVVAGQTFAANTTYAVRWDMSSKTETSGRVYAADQDTTAPSDMFWVIGVISGGAGGVAIGDSIPMTSLGMWTLGSSDGTFAATGVPVWLTSAGAFSLTAPTTTGFACTKIGMVQSSSQMWISPQVMGVN